MDLSHQLSRYVLSTEDITYQEGRHDCLLFVLAWIDLITGTAFHRRLHGQYATKFQGLRKFAPKGIPAAFGELMDHGWTLCPSGHLPVGSILFTLDRHPVPVIWSGTHGITLRYASQGHLFLAPSQLATPAWLPPVPQSQISTSWPT